MSTLLQNLTEFFAKYGQGLLLAVALIGLAGVLVQIFAWLYDIGSGFYYYSVTVPRFRKNLQPGDDARIDGSDLPVSIVHVRGHMVIVSMPVPAGASYHSTLVYRHQLFPT